MADQQSKVARPIRLSRIRATVTLLLISREYRTPDYEASTLKRSIDNGPVPGVCPRKLNLRAFAASVILQANCRQPVVIVAARRHIASVSDKGLCGLSCTESAEEPL
jgi:hypothetical protein